MKSIKYFLFLAAFSTFVFSCKNDVKPEVKTVEVAADAVKEIDPNATYAMAEFTIDGMTCAIGCAATIQKKISGMEGVKTATVDFDKKLAMVEYDEAKVTPISLTEAVAQVSDVYKVSDMKTVDAFSNAKACSADCKKACCANKTEEEKTACAKDCKKACCSKKEAA
ncbi:heavy metal-associated domain-containing protein [Flavobacteriaceae bacterium SZ-1-7]|uniref:heavy-metal-associated domain-containing protein n=1 Tax=Tamlana sedimenti TaxID=3134126 RepID=UPI0031221AF7